MHDPLLLTDEHCAELAEVTNSRLDELLTMLGVASRIPRIPTPYSANCPSWLGADMAFNASDVRELIAKDGIYSDWPTPDMRSNS